MTDKIVPRNIFGIATGIEEEANNLNACRSLMNEALQFSYVDPEAAGLAQEQMFFLVRALGDVQRRLEEIKSAAYNVASAEKAVEEIA